MGRGASGTGHYQVVRDLEGHVCRTFKLENIAGKHMYGASLIIGITKV